MAKSVSQTRLDQASRTILATPKAIYQAMTNAEALVNWRPPQDMTGHFDAFDPRPDGCYRMTLFYADNRQGAGKSAPDRDIVNGRFVEMLPFERIVEEVQFETGNAAFFGTMRVTTTLAPVAGGTKVSIMCEDVPVGIKAEEHAAGIASTLKNLALFVE